MTTLTHEDELATLLDDIKVGDVVHRGSDQGSENETPPMVVDQVVPVNRRRLWDSETGEMYLAPKWIVGRRSETTIEGTLRGYGLLGIVTDMGLPKWLDRDPGIPAIVRNNFKCRLHPEDPDRAKWTGMGFPVCSKGGIPSEYELENHMRIKHKTVWQALERERENNRRDRDSDQQRLMTQALLRLAGEPSIVQGPVKVSVPFAEVEPVEPVDLEPVSNAEEVVQSSPVKKFPSQMTNIELRDHMLSQGIVYDPTVTKAKNLAHLRNMKGLPR